MDAQTWESGAKFLSSNLTREPDCLVLDIRMPEMSGPELRESLRSAGRAIPTVFITAHSEAEDALEGSGLEVLRKPFGDQALLGAISRAMARDGVV